MIYVKINGTLYPAHVSGTMHDSVWDGRESKSIHLLEPISYANANNLFPDGVVWHIVQIEGVEGSTQQTEFDNSAFCIRGDLTMHTDGTCTVKMGKATDLEEAYEMIYGGI